jgi:hypothetical protein
VRLDRSTKLIAIDKEAHPTVRHEHGFGETRSFAREALAPRASRQIFAFDLLRVEFAPSLGRGGEVTGIDSRRIGVKVALPTCWVPTL